MHRLDHRRLRLPRGCLWLAATGFLAAGLPLAGFVLWGVVEGYRSEGWRGALAFEPFSFVFLLLGAWLIKFAVDCLEEARDPIAGRESWRKIRAPETDPPDPAPGDVQDRG